MVRGTGSRTWTERARAGSTLVLRAGWLVAIFSGALFGQEGEGGTTVSADFRGKLMIGFSSLFVIVVVYLVMSHRRNARLRADAEFLSRRLDELEKGEEGSGGTSG